METTLSLLLYKVHEGTITMTSTAKRNNLKEYLAINVRNVDAGAVGPPPPHHQPKQPRKLSMCQLAIMIFTLTCSGPFGIEEAVQSGGVPYTLLALAVVPFLYAIPQSLMCSELGSMMPCYHGYIIWVYRAYDRVPYIGNFIGFYNSIGEIVALGTDIPIYVVLIQYYVEQFISTYSTQFALHGLSAYFFKLGIILLGAFLGALNISALGNCNILFMAVMAAPFVFGFLYSLPTVDFTTYYDANHRLAYNESERYQWGLFLSTILWLHTGWDSVGALMSELSFSKTKIFLAFLAAMALDYAMYTIGILGALSIPCTYAPSEGDTQCWSDGYLYTAYNQIAPALGYFIIVSGFLSNFSCYLAELCVQARHFWALSQPYVILLQDGTLCVEGKDGTYYDDDMNELKDFAAFHKGEPFRKIKIGIFPNWLCGTIWAKTGAPVHGVFLQSALCAVLVLFDYATLLQGTVLINAITWALEFSSFLILRYTEPDARRDFKVGGGMCVAWFITSLKILVVAAVLFFILYDTPEYLWYLLGHTVVVLVWYTAYRCCSC